MKCLKANKLNIKYTYGALAISNLTFEAVEGKILVILGGSEAGKTSLLKCIAGLETRANGVLLLNGKDLLTMKIKDRNVCFISTNGMFFDNRNVYYNLYYPLKVRKTEKNSIADKIMFAADKVGLSKSILLQKIKKISEEEKFKVAIARCFLRDADVYLIDNPLKLLDKATRSKNFEFLLNIMKELSTRAVVLYATDDGNESKMLNAQTILLNYGITLQQGKIDDICDNPTSLTALESMHGECTKKEVLISDEDGLYITYDGKRIILEREKLLSEIFIGKPVIAVMVNNKIKIFDADSERSIYFD